MEPAIGVCAKVAQGKLTRKLLNMTSRLLHELLHKQALREFSNLGVKLRAHLRFELPKTHKADANREVRLLRRRVLHEQ